MKKEKLKTLELFGGIGAPRAALEKLNYFEIKAVDYVEIYKNAVKAYNAMYDLSYQEQDVLDWNLNVDLLIHGSPCVDFSKAGKNDIISGRSILYQRTLEIIDKELNPKPKYIIWENVKGLLTSKHYKHLNHYIFSLKNLGYKNYMSVLEANEFGIPQTRPRVFIISIRSDLNQQFDFDELERKPLIPLKEFLNFTNDHPECTLEIKQPSMIKAIEDGKVAILINKSATITCRNVRWNNVGVCFKDPNFYKQDLSKYDASLFDLKKVKKDFPEFFDGKELKDVFRYLSAREVWALQGYTVSDEFKEQGNYYVIPRKSDNKLINGTFNRIWKTNNSIGTIIASNVLKVGNIFENNLIYRNLTSFECWKLQGFSKNQFDKVKATGISDNDMYQLAGNSICVNVLEAIFKELLIEKKSKTDKYLVNPKPLQINLFNEYDIVEKIEDCEVLQNEIQ